MKFLKFFMPLLALMGISLSVHAQQNPDVQDGSRFDTELNERDWEALRKYLNLKRDKPLEDKNTRLAISGDVRFEYRHMTEKFNGTNLRGPHRRNPFNGTPVSRNDFDCEFNLKFDYLTDRSWAVAHLQYDNSAGVDSQDLNCGLDHHGWFGSGKCDELCLRKAFMGYNFYNSPCFRFDIELGRRGNLYHVFDSRVQFLSRFDGVFLKFSGESPLASEWFVKLAGFVVDERVNHYSWATELGLMNVWDSGFDVKYSFIDWGGPVRNRCVKPEPEGSCDFIYHHLFRGIAFDYAVSQWTLTYHIDPAYTCGIPAKLFGAFLMNHKRKNVTIKKLIGFETRIDPLTGLPVPTDIPIFSKHRYRANLGWYAGFQMGEVKKEGDWAFELQYQVVQAVAIPGQDMSGIGTGNAFDWTLTFNNFDNTNFRGWRAEGLYALTDNITIDTIVEASRTDNAKIGHFNTYSKVEVEAIYAF